MIRATENWVISDRFLHRFAFGYNRFGNANRSVYFNAGWPSKIGLTQSAGYDIPAVRVHRRGGDSGNAGQLRIAQPQRDLRGQHDHPGRSDDHHGQAQHQDRLRGAFLLPRKRQRRRDRDLQLQLRADEPARVRHADRACLRELPAGRGADVRAGPSRSSTIPTTRTTTTSTCRTTTRSRRSSRSTSASAGRFCRA